MPRIRRTRSRAVAAPSTASLPGSVALRPPADDPRSLDGHHAASSEGRFAYTCTQPGAHARHGADDCPHGRVCARRDDRHDERRSSRARKSIAVRGARLTLLGLHGQPAVSFPFFGRGLSSARSRSPGLQRASRRTRRAASRSPTAAPPSASPRSPSPDPTFPSSGRRLTSAGCSTSPTTPATTAASC